MTDQPAPMDVPPPPNEPEKKRRRWPWIVGGVVVLIIVIGLFARPKSSEQTPAAAAATTSASTTAPSSSSSSPPSPSPSPSPTPPSPTPSPTPTPTSTEPTTPAYQPIPDEHYEGTGDDVVTLTKGAKPALLTFSCPSCDSNVVVDTESDLLVNEIGTYSGTHLIDPYNNDNTTTVEITADGSWTLDITDITNAPEATSGAGDSVIWVRTGSVVQISHDGESNFVVEAYTPGEPRDLLVNEIGPYEGRQAISVPAVLDISADGNWSITPNS